MGRSGGGRAKGEITSESRRDACKARGLPHNSNRAGNAAVEAGGLMATKQAKPKSRKPATKTASKRATPKRATSDAKHSAASTPQPKERAAEKPTWAEVHARSLADASGFWGAAAADIDWVAQWD